MTSRFIWIAIAALGSVAAAAAAVVVEEEAMVAVAGPEEVAVVMDRFRGTSRH